MKTNLRSITCLCVTLLAAAPADGKPPRKGGGKQAEPAAPPAVSQSPSAPASQQPPSVQLSKLFQNSLDKILSPLDQKVTMPRAEVSLLRASFAQQLAQAPQAQKAQYQSAVAVCDALAQAMDERDKAVQNYQAALSTHGVVDVQDVRKSAPTRGRGRAGAAAAEARKESQEENRAGSATASKDAFLNSGILKSWSDRAAQLRQQIQQLYARVLQAEQKASASPGAAAATPGA